MSLGGMKDISSMKPVRITFFIALLVLGTGCSTLAGKEDTCVVMARRAQVRSSTAVVAADLKEVVRGDTLVILESMKMEIPVIAETAADHPGIPSFRALLALAYLEGELPFEAAELLAGD